MSKRAKAVAKLEQFTGREAPRDDLSGLRPGTIQGSDGHPQDHPPEMAQLSGDGPETKERPPAEIAPAVLVPTPVSVASQEYQDAYARFLEARQPRKNIGIIEGEPGAEYEIIEIGNGPDVKNRHRVKPGADEIRLVNRWAPLESPGLLYRRSESQRDGRALFMVHVEHVPDGGQAS